MSQTYDVQNPESENYEDALETAVQAVRDGHCVVLPTDTVYGIGCDAFNPDAVAGLLAAKQRDRTMPPPVLVPHLQTVEALAGEIPDDARRLMVAMWPGPLTVILPAQTTLHWDLGDTNGTVAVRVPDHDVALDILARTGPMAVSSANLTGQPAATTAALAAESLGSSVSVYLDGGTSPQTPASTIVDFTVDPPKVVRPGAITLDELREVHPGIADVHGHRDHAAQTPAEDSAHDHVRPAVAPKLTDDNPDTPAS